MFLCLVVATCPFSFLLFGLYGSKLQCARGSGGGEEQSSLHVSKKHHVYTGLVGTLSYAQYEGKFEMAVEYWKWQWGLLCIVCIFNELYERL